MKEIEITKEAVDKLLSTCRIFEGLIEKDLEDEELKGENRESAVEILLKTKWCVDYLYEIRSQNIQIWKEEFKQLLEEKES